jgi:proline dehydrogenase
MREAFPRYAFMRRAVMRFMPGEDLEDALRAGQAFAGQHIGVIYTRLGENVLDTSAASEVAQHYVGALERIAQLQLDAQISVKLTQLGLDIAPGACEANLRTVVERAEALGNMIWIDMEQSALVDATLDMYRSVRRDHANVGVCLQSYLRRTNADLESLMPLTPAIRLVKGAYAEPPSVAFPDKIDVDANYLQLALQLIEDTRRGAALAVHATHDPALIERVCKGAETLQVPRGEVEFQMLYGIRQGEQQRLAAEGYRVRVLISYGTHWYPWFMRRLAERPANVLFVLRNLVGR